MSTYFDTLPKNFKDVPVSDNGIPVPEFLEATEGLVKMFDLFNATAFNVVQNDMNGNVKKIRETHNSNPSEFPTLQSILVAEKGSKKRPTSEGLLWLRRGLDFTAQGFRRSIENPEEELSVSFNKAYENTLKPHHSFIVKPVFALAMKACPYRKDFYAKLGSDQEKANAQFKEWLSALEKILTNVSTFAAQGDFDKGF